MRTRHHIDPDVIFLDAKNLPDFDTHQFEGKIERSIPRVVLYLVAAFILIVVTVYSGRLWYLQINQGAAFALRAENNRLQHDTVFSERGVITDRNGVPLVWNGVKAASGDFSLRQYITDSGFSHLVGYVKYPAKDSSGVYYDNEYTPQDGVEKIFNDQLKGIHGVKLTETDVHGGVVTESVLEPPKHGDTIALSIDARLQKALYDVSLKPPPKASLTLI